MYVYIGVGLYVLLGYQVWGYFWTGNAKVPHASPFIITAFRGSKLTIGLDMKAFFVADADSCCNQIALFYFFFVFFVLSWIFQTNSVPFLLFIIMRGGMRGGCRPSPHDKSKIWDMIRCMLEDIRTARALLYTDDFDKILQRLKQIEKEIDILSVLLGRVWQNFRILIIFVDSMSLLVVNSMQNGKLWIK